MNARRLALFAPLIVFLLVAAVFLRLENRMVSGEYDPSVLPSALIGKPVPAFELSLLHYPERVVTAEDLDGQFYLLNVWATWCVACRAEHGYLMELAERGITIYGLNYKDDRAAAQQWLARDGDPYQMSLFDEQGTLGLNMGVYGAPETYVVENGLVRYRHVGVMSEKVWQQRIMPALRD